MERSFEWVHAWLVGNRQPTNIMLNIVGAVVLMNLGISFLSVEGIILYGTLLGLPAFSLSILMFGSNSKKPDGNAMTVDDCGIQDLQRN